MNKDKKNLGYLGETFQFRLTKEFMENHSFFEDLCPIIDQNMFTDPYLKVFVGVMKNYYEVNGNVPSYDMTEIELRNMAHSDREMETYMAILDKIKNTPSDGSERIRDLASKFFRQQNIIRVANQILKIAGDGDVSKFDACEGLLNEAMTQGVHNDYGEGVFDHLNETLADDYRCPIPTGIGKIDEALEGGLGKGELGVIIGPTSFGKTSLTTAMASHAACNGFKVLQIVFEDKIKQIQRKHIGRITNIEAKDLSKPQYIDVVRSTIETFPEKELLGHNLRIVKFASGEKTARQIERFIKKLINNGFKPDLTIIDYFECVSSEADRAVSNEYELEGKTMRKFESMASELDMGIWIPSQGTKDSINLDLVTMDKMGGSVRKSQVAHIIMSIARTIDDIAANKATIAILKNRAGCSGKVLNNVEFNNGTCRVSTDNADELENLLELKKNKEEARLDIQRQIVRGL